MAHLWYFNKRDTRNFSQYNNSNISSFDSDNENQIRIIQYEKVHFIGSCNSFGCYFFLWVGRGGTVSSPPVAPVVYKGVRFIAPPDAMGFVQAWDIQTGKKVWEKKVYDVVINPWMEEDVQLVFITSLSAGDDILYVVNEKGGKYSITIPHEILKEDVPSTIRPDKEVYEMGEAINMEVFIKNLKDVRVSLDGSFEIGAELWIWAPLEVGKLYLNLGRKRRFIIIFMI